MYLYRIEAYTHALLFLTDCFSRHQQEKSGSIFDKIAESIALLKEAIFNHRLDAGVIANHLSALSLELDAPDQRFLLKIAYDMQNSEYTRVPRLMWENEFSRRFESEIATTLLKFPTKAMMAMVKKVSLLILNAIEKNENTCQIPEVAEEAKRNIFIILDGFYVSLTNREDSVALGAFAVKPNFKQVEEILLKNRPEDLYKIMYIHYKFALNAFRKLPEVLTKTGRGSPIKQRVDAANIDFYETDMFTASINRGRKDRLVEVAGNYVNRLGIMLHSQNSDGLGNMPEPKWLPDCLGQAAELDPFSPGFPIVRDMIYNDVPYVSGYSGMCSLLMPQMMILCDDVFEEQQRNYLCAVMAYITGGGFHSIHEVIAPCALILEIIPGYVTQVPDREHQALPPNYKLFFDLTSTNDPELLEKLDLALNNYLKFACTKINPELSVGQFVGFSWPEYQDAKETVKESQLGSLIAHRFG